jgi:hypothetical protein
MIKRQRPRPNNMRQHRPGQNHNANTSGPDDNQEIRNKPRNHYQQLHDKYANLARDMLRSGERIEAENYFQHAEHYLRQLNERIAYEAEQQQLAQQRQQTRENHERQRQQNQARHQQNQNSGHQSSSQNGGIQVGDAPSVEAEQNVPADNTTETGQQNQQRRRGPRTYFKRPREEGAQIDNGQTAASNEAPSTVVHIAPAAEAAPVVRRPRKVAADHESQI